MHIALTARPDRLALVALILLAISLVIWGTGQTPKINLEACNLNLLKAECGILRVHENRAAQRGRVIDIHVAVIRARGAHPQPDPIFYFAGGPGGSAMDDAAYALRVLDRANLQHDLVLVDQRGTGHSNRLTCPMPVGISLGLTPIRTQDIQDLRRCLNGLNADPAAYTTAWAMDDVDDVRAALGYEQINLYGESYGATAGQVYLQRHARHVRSMVLEGSSLIDVPLFERFPRSIQEALDFQVKRCQADAACTSTYPDLEGKLAAVLDRVENQAVLLPLADPIEGLPVPLTRGMLVEGIYGLLVKTETAVHVPRLIHQAYLGEWDELVQPYARLFDPQAPATEWRVMNLTILCHEDWAKMRPQALDASSAGSFVRPADVRRLVVPEEICAIMPRPLPSALHQPLGSSTAPVLIIANQADPNDPPANVADAVLHYPNSRTLIAPGQSHGYTGFDCRGPLLADFFNSADGANLDASDLALEPLPPLAR